MQRSVKITIFLIISAGIATGVLTWSGKYKLSHFKAEKAKIAQDIQQKMVLDDLKAESAPADQNAANDAPDINSTDSQNNNQSDNSPPAKYLLAMPFYSQAPNGNWDAVHEEMCEEASLLNAGLFLQNKKLNVDDYDKELLKLKDLGERLVGTWVSTSISDTRKISDTYFGRAIQSKIIDNPSVSDIEREVAAGRPVIVPLAGRDIGNPNYTPPGPIYHMLVVKGYDENFFITNDVGTRKGNSYVYKKNVIMDNMHDWNAEDIHKGAKRVLVLF